MKVDFVHLWVGGIDKNLPEKFREGREVEVTMEDLETLSQSYDIAIMRFAQIQPSKKEISRGAQPVPDKIGLCLDAPRAKFRQR